MFNFKSLFKNNGSFKIERAEDGQWMVTKKFKILYIGTKEKCQTFIDNRLTINKGLATD